MKFLSYIVAVFHEDDDFGHHHDDHMGELTPELMEEQAREDFDQMDTDKTGYLTREKVRDFLNDPSAEADIEDFFVKADTDKDDKVSFAEYYKFVVDMYEQYRLQTAEAMGGENLDFGELDEMIASMQAGGPFDDWDDEHDHDHHHHDHDHHDHDHNHHNHDHDEEL
jgi:Zn-finger nucleic acid-binding protein